MRFISLFLTFFLAFTGILATPYRHKPHKPHKPVNTSEIIDFKVNDLLKAIHKIDVQTIQFNKSISLLDSHHTFRTALRLLLLAREGFGITSAVDSATKFCRTASNFTEYESDTVVQRLMILQPHAASTMKNVLAHKYDFDRAILGSGSVSLIIAKRIRKSSIMADKFVQALAKKLVPKYAVLAPSTSVALKEGYSRAAEAFEKPGGKWVMPDFSEVTDMLKEKLRNIFKHKEDRLNHGERIRTRTTNSTE